MNIRRRTVRMVFIIISAAEGGQGGPSRPVVVSAAAPRALSVRSALKNPLEKFGPRPRALQTFGYTMILGFETGETLKLAL